MVNSNVLHIISSQELTFFLNQFVNMNWAETAVEFVAQVDVSTAVTVMIA